MCFVDGGHVLFLGTFFLFFVIHMFYLVGLGLCDEKDITVRGLEVCSGSDRSRSIDVFLCTLLDR